MPLRDVQQSCRPDHLIGLWAIDEIYFLSILPRALEVNLVELKKQNEEENQNKPDKGYEVDESGVARVDISGPMTKYPSSYSSMFGGSASLEKQKAIRDAVKDTRVKSIAIVADSPGGTVAGTAELADEVKAAAQIKPVYGIVDDSATSAAYWVLSQAPKIYANRTAKVGSIGTTIRLYDTSGKMEQQGIKAVPIDSGKFKSVGMAGKEITEEDKAELQRHVNQINSHFISAVAEGRKLDPKVIKDFEARVFVGDEAKQKGLVDKICSVEEALEEIKGFTANPETVKIAAAPAARSPSMFNASQMEAIARAIPSSKGLADDALATTIVNHTNHQSEALVKANDRIAELEKELKATQAKIPETCDPKIASGHLRVFEREMNQLLKEEKIMPEQLDIIKDCIKAKDGTYVTSLVSSDGTIMLPSESFVKLAELNKPKGLTEEQSNVQTLDRQVPKTGSDEREMTPEQKAYNESMYDRVGKRVGGNGKAQNNGKK